MKNSWWFFEFRDSYAAAIDDVFLLVVVVHRVFWRFCLIFEFDAEWCLSSQSNRIYIGVSRDCEVSNDDMCAWRGREKNILDGVLKKSNTWIRSGLVKGNQKSKSAI